jgi:hypothetical protein
MPTNWKSLGVFTENMDVELSGIHLWSHVSQWHRLGEIQLPHPYYSSQTHRLDIYELEIRGKLLNFAAGEVSNGAYAFYALAADLP